MVLLMEFDFYLKRGTPNVKPIVANQANNKTGSKTQKEVSQLKCQYLFNRQALKNLTPNT
jgi:hypothetical protein